MDISTVQQSLFIAVILLITAIYIAVTFAASTTWTSRTALSLQDAERELTSRYADDAASAARTAQTTTMLRARSREFAVHEPIIPSSTTVIESVDRRPLPHEVVASGTLSGRAPRVMVPLLSYPGPDNRWRREALEQTKQSCWPEQTDDNMTTGDRHVSAADLQPMPKSVPTSMLSDVLAPLRAVDVLPQSTVTPPHRPQRDTAVVL